MARNKTSYFVLSIVAVAAMLLAPAHSVAQPQAKPVPGVDEAASRQPEQLPPVPSAREETRKQDTRGVEPYERMKYPRAARYLAGQTDFIIWSSMASVYGGIALSQLLDIEDMRLGAATILGTTALGFFASKQIAKNAKITKAMADAYGAGLVLGAINGLALSTALTECPTPETAPGPEPTPEPDGAGEVELGKGLTGRVLASCAERNRLVHGASLGGMILGGAISYAMAKRTDPTRGQVAFTALSAKMGLASAGLGLMLAQPGDRPNSSRLALVGGVNLGALAGAMVAPGLDWSLSRVRLVGLGSLLGAVAGWSTAAIITGGPGEGELDDRSSRIWAASTLVGMWGGFGVAARLTKDMPADRRFARKRGTTISPLPVQGGGMGVSLSGSF